MKKSSLIAKNITSLRDAVDKPPLLTSLSTPYFLINERELLNNIQKLKAALNKYWNNSIIGYSFKTNSLPWLLNYIKEVGCYAEVVSDDEYELAKSLGYEKIIYNGVAKSKETFLEALKQRSIVNIDTFRELLWLNELENECHHKFEVGIRINFDLEAYCPGETTMEFEGGRFGFCYENGELEKVISHLHSLKNIYIAGIHLHSSTKTRSLNIYKNIAKIACEIKKKYSLELKYIDIGGGFFGGLEDKPQFGDYLKIISNELSTEFDKNEVLLIVEPGTSIISSPVQYVSTVIDVKRTTRNIFVTTDGSHIHVNPLKNKSIKFYNIQLECDLQREIIEKQVISGFTCMEDDRILTIQDSPELKVGDKIIYEKIGAYSLSLSPLFIKFFPAVYVDKNGVIVEARKKWTFNNYL